MSPNSTAVSFTYLSWGPSWWAHWIHSFSRKGNKRKDSAHQSASPWSRPWTYFAPASLYCCANIAHTFKAPRKKKKGGGEGQTAATETERHGEKMEVATLLAFIWNTTLAPGTVFTSHGLLKGLYYVTPPSITRLFSCDLIPARMHKCTQGNACDQVSFYPLICKSPWNVWW